MIVYTVYSPLDLKIGLAVTAIVFVLFIIQSVKLVHGETKDYKR